MARKPDRMSAAEYRAGAGIKVPTEEDECIWLFQWAQTQTLNGMRISEVLIHIPNGAYLGADAKTRAITMGVLKKTGLQPGCFDYIIPVPKVASSPNRLIPGLWLEMKRTKGGTVSEDQKKFRKSMELLGWRCEIAKGWIEASKIIENYLGTKGEGNESGTRR